MLVLTRKFVKHDNDEHHPILTMHDNYRPCIYTDEWCCQIGEDGLCDEWIITHGCDDYSYAMMKNNRICVFEYNRGRLRYVANAKWGEAFSITSYGMKTQITYKGNILRKHSSYSTPTFEQSRMYCLSGDILDADNGIIQGLPKPKRCMKYKYDGSTRYVIVTNDGIYICVGYELIKSEFKMPSNCVICNLYYINGGVIAVDLCGAARRFVMIDEHGVMISNEEYHNYGKLVYVNDSDILYDNIHGTFARLVGNKIKPIASSIACDYDSVHIFRNNVFIQRHDGVEQYKVVPLLFHTNVYRNRFTDVVVRYQQ